MEMNKLFALGILFLGGYVHAGTDRFGNVRAEVPRSSFTIGNESNVILASGSITTGEGGGVILRYIECFGANPSTITVYNSMVFDGNSSTATKYSYLPNNAQGSVKGFYGSVFISSVASYQKEGIAPCTIGWDYTTIPKWGGVGTNR
jgi:hypothetical protein